MYVQSRVPWLSDPFPSLGKTMVPQRYHTPSTSVSSRPRGRFGNVPKRVRTLVVGGGGGLEKYHSSFDTFSHVERDPVHTLVGKRETGFPY